MLLSLAKPVKEGICWHQRNGPQGKTEPSRIGPAGAVAAVAQDAILRRAAGVQYALPATYGLRRVVKTTLLQFATHFVSAQCALALFVTNIVSAQCALALFATDFVSAQCALALFVTHFVSAQCALALFETNIVSAQCALALFETHFVSAQCALPLSSVLTRRGKRGSFNHPRHPGRCIGHYPTCYVRF